MKYLSNEAISKLDNLHIKAKKVVEGFMVGLHKSPFHGFSVEFSDHRAYGAGDELKHIDWKLWAKTDRFFVKRYEEETNLKAFILVDQSRSMEYTSQTTSKMEYSKILAASLSYLLIKNQDAVGMYAFNNEIRKSIDAKSTNTHLSALLSEMEKMQPKNKTNISDVLHQCAEKTNKKGLIILISDLMDNQQKIMMGLKHFLHKGHEVIVFHILDPKEIEFDFNERMKFVDLETKQSIITDPRNIRTEYKKKIQKIRKFYTDSCGKYKIDYVPLSTGEPVGAALKEYLFRRKKIS